VVQVAKIKVLADHSPGLKVRVGVGVCASENGSVSQLSDFSFQLLGGINGGEL